MQRLLANTTRLLAGEISAADADDDAKADFLEIILHVGDYCPGEYEIARKYRSGGWDERSYLRKLIKAANAEAVFSDD